MRITTHQPIFLPWPGLLNKAVHTDAVVLLDCVQFPLGRGWMTRNRLKSEQGELWLRVPVHKKGRSGQAIHEVDLYESTEWRTKHLQGIRQQYVHAPYSADYFGQLQSIFQSRQRRLSDFNLELMRFLFRSFNVPTPLILQSSLSVTGKATDLIVSVCKKLQANTYVTLSPVAKYLDTDTFRRNGIRLDFVDYRPPIYPQLWGDFRYNVSALDLLLNCGPEKGLEIIKRAG